MEKAVAFYINKIPGIEICLALVKGVITIDQL
jgi:hypothetical protein